MPFAICNATVALAPVITTTITNTCGNLGEWQPFTSEELTRRCQSRDNYVRLYSVAVEKLIGAGYLLASDRAQLVQHAAALYDNPAGY